MYQQLCFKSLQLADAYSLSIQFRLLLCLKASVYISLGVIAMHIETLDAVHQENKRLPPIQKVCIPNDSSKWYSYQQFITILLI